MAGAGGARPAAMPERAFLAVTNRWPAARRMLFNWLFETLAAITRDVDTWTFMNYGYAALDDGAPALSLEPGDEAERYCIQLYQHAASTVALAGRDVVEVSCGRGGGASYMRRYLKPRQVTGIDFSRRQIAFRRRVHDLPNLEFRYGEAEDVPLPDACADVVVNIEATCLYADVGRFFAEVARLLRPGGSFVYADFHLVAELDDTLARLQASGLRIERREDITRNVERALAIDHARRLAAVRAHAPFLLRRLLNAFAGTQGTVVPESLASGRMVYLCLVLSKPVPA